MAYPTKKTLADIPPRKVNTIAVYRTDHVSRWNDQKWIDNDHEKIAAVYGPLRSNHLRDKAIGPRQAFNIYLHQHLSPETVRAVYEVEHFYALAYNAFTQRVRADRDEAKRSQRDEALAA